MIITKNFNILATNPVNMSHEGIDVSHNNGRIDWSAVSNDSAGIRFAYIKATESNNFTDPQFSVNWPNCMSAGIQRGAYHYFHPDVDATLQANYFLGALQAAGGFQGVNDLPPAIDVEEPLDGVSVTDYLNGVQTWLNVVQQSLSVPPVIYTNIDTWTNTVSNSSQLSNYDLWLAQWGVTAPSPPGGWTNWTFWQYTNTGNVGGISPVDRDRFSGTLLSGKRNIT